ncbi:hypothetical protein MADA3029_910113 [Vibrio nigripulchritudo MADA3029]|nr:hypothetical protein VIBNIMADA3020_810113 [Vibrio nigripulchritudo MADA3020]CCN62111.1 hypothetical protein MADA3029_910113 [Vibrio nigripulchritudo MADA3029]
MFIKLYSNYFHKQNSKKLSPLNRHMYSHQLLIKPLIKTILIVSAFP